MKKIFIIIVSYNGGNKLVKTLNFVKKIIEKDKNVSLIVVDNASRDGSIKEIKKIIRSFKLIRNRKNLGFARANNQGMKQAIKDGADKILLLNQDAYLRNKDFLSLIKNQNDISSPIIKFKRNSEFIYDLGGKLNRVIMRPYHIEKFKRQNKNYEVDYVSGCCMLIDVSVLKKIGYLEEDFFLYFEDVDFCLRASKAGFKIGVELNAEVLHDFDEKEQKSIKSIYYLIKSNLLFINKWAKFPNKTMAYFYWFFISSKMLFRKLVYNIVKL
ncbi:MAG TPA: glycosyltransferase family 2 protein [Patescibacteria group bacterium]|nr:glycosyltransferase family 2 protein [Patescibacteria group bacterium]